MESVTCPTAVAEDRGKLQKLIWEVEGALEGGWGKGSNRLGGGWRGSQAWWKWVSCPCHMVILCPPQVDVLP